MSVPEVFQSFIGGFQQSASVKSVFGEPITAEGRTLIPVAKVGYGGGAGLGPREHNGQPIDQEAEQQRVGVGAGAGAKPIGVVEVSAEGTRFISIGIGKRILGAAAVGFVLGFLVGRRR
jgi:uncharacterized spore protein YtfJ